MSRHLVSARNKLREKQDLAGNLFCHFKAAKRKANDSSPLNNAN